MKISMSIEYKKIKCCFTLVSHQTRASIMLWRHTLGATVDSVPCQLQWAAGAGSLPSKVCRRVNKY